jgi:hypothetical protein
MKFKSIEANDIPLIAPYFALNNYRTCNYTVGATYMWRKYLDMQYCIEEDTLFFRSVYSKGHHCYAFPLSAGRHREAVERLLQAMPHTGEYKICSVPEEALAFLKNEYGKRVHYSASRDWCDYLYLYADLLNLTGKKYNGQRNHINRFKRENPVHRFVTIDLSNVQKAIDFLQRNEGIIMKANDLAVEEYHRSIEIFNYMVSFNLCGGYLEVAGKVAGITLGEIINDTLTIHIEKALRDYHGAYPMLSNAFLQSLEGRGIKYVNREEDVGDEGLRKSKTDYHPIALLPKYFVNLKR